MAFELPYCITFIGMIIMCIIISLVFSVIPAASKDHERYKDNIRALLTTTVGVLWLAQYIFDCKTPLGPRMDIG